MKKITLLMFCILLLLGSSIEVSALCWNPLELFCIFGGGDSQQASGETPLPPEKPKGFIGTSGSSLEWNIEKTGAEENLDVSYDILNDTATEFCVDFIDKAKYENALSLSAKDIKQVPIEKTKLTTDFNIEKTSFDLSNADKSDECFVLNYDELIGGMEFKIGWDSVLVGIGFTSGLGRPYNEKIVRDSKGNLHLVWEDANRDLQYSNSTDNGETWTSKLLFTGSTDRPNLLINSSDGLWALWGEDVDDIYYSHSSDYGVTWTTPTQVPNFDGNSSDAFFRVSAVMDDKDNVHFCVVTIEWDNNGDNDWLAYSNHTSDGWSGLVWVNQNSTDDSDSCDIETDSNGVVYIIASGSDEDDIDLWTSAAWGSNNETIIHAGTGDSSPGIFIDSNDKIVAAWEQNNNDLGFGNSTPGSAITDWDLTTIDSDPSTLPDIKITDNGSIYILYANASTTNRDVLQAFWNVSTGVWAKGIILVDDTWTGFPLASMRGSRIGSDTITDRIDYIYWNTTDDGLYFDYFEVTSPLVAEEVDTTPPTFSAFSDNASFLTINDTTVQLSATIEDDSNISAYVLSTNDTLDSSWKNETIINLDGLRNVTTIWNYTIRNFTNGGTFGWRFWANDTANNSAVSAIQTFFVFERENPNSNITLNNTSPKINQVVNISMNVSDNLDLDFCWFYNNISNTNSSLISISGTSEHNLCFNITTINVSHRDVLFRGYVNDTSGNVNSSQTVITVANTAPNQPTISFPVDGINYSSIPYINFTATDADSDLLTFNIYINGSLNITTTTNITQWNASDGYYNLTVTANDGIDSSINSTVIIFRLDSTNPSFSNQEKNETPNTGENLRMNITITESNCDSYKFFWNGSGAPLQNDSAISCTAGVVSTTKTGITAHQRVCWGYWANDTAGNSASSSIDCFTVPNTAPTQPTISFPIDGINYSSIPYINYTAIDADGDVLTFTIFINNILNITTTTNVTQWNASDSLYNLIITANDGTDSSINSTIINFRLDTTNPIISNLKASSITNQSSVIEWSCGELCNYSILWFNNSIRNDNFLIDSINNNTFKTSHNPFLTNLTKLTTYFINLTVSDVSGNSVTNNTFNFTTIETFLISDNFLDFYDIFVNELIGDIWLFIFLGLIMIWFLAAKNKLTTEVSMLFAILFLSAIFAKTGLTILWVFTVLGVGSLFYYKLSKIIRNG